MPVITKIQLNPVPESELPDFGAKTCRVFVMRR